MKRSPHAGAAQAWSAWIKKQVLRAAANAVQLGRRTSAPLVPNLMLAHIKSLTEPKGEAAASKHAFNQKRERERRKRGSGKNLEKGKGGKQKRKKRGGGEARYAGREGFIQNYRRQKPSPAPWSSSSFVFFLFFFVVNQSSAYTPGLYQKGLGHGAMLFSLSHTHPSFLSSAPLHVAL